MARRIIRELIDDLDGGTADESITFGLDGVQYEIDLSARNAARLRDAIAPFVEVAAKSGRGGIVPGARGRAATSRGPARGDRVLNRAIREWAQTNGIELSDRGRIRQDIIDRYHAETAR